MTWTTGAVQKDRYNLGKYIDSIDATLREDGRYDLQIRPKTAPEHKVPGVDEFDLEDHVGKELADKIVKDFSAGKKYFYIDIPGHVKEHRTKFDTEEAVRNWIREEGLDESDPFFNMIKSDFEPITYSGLDLEMGGKFHEFIYDKKVPQYAKEFLKNYRDANGNKIVPKKISQAGDLRALQAEFDSINERMTALANEANTISPGGENAPIRIGVVSRYREIEEELQELEPLRDQLEKELISGETLFWYIDTTPEMEEDFIEGMPLTMDTTKEQPAFA